MAVVVIVDKIVLDEQVGNEWLRMGFESVVDDG